MNWHYKVNFLFFWINFIFLSFGAAGFWVMVFFWTIIICFQGAAVIK